MNLKEAIDCGRYTVFSKMGDENRNKHITIVNYIDQLASAASMDISSWNIFEIFGAGRGNNLITNRREINRLFFAKFRQEKAKQPVNELTLDAQVQKHLNDKAQELVTRQVQELAVRKDGDLRAARRLATQMDEKLASAFRLDQQVRALSNRLPDIGAQLQTIAAEGFWKYEQMQGGMLTLVTAGDVICNHINKSAGIDVRVNLGKFRAKLNLDNMNLRAESCVPRDENIFMKAGLPCHPHISSSICWGRSQSTVLDMLASCELVGAFRILANLLNDYDDEAPYASLSQYKQAFDNNARGITGEECYDDECPDEDDLDDDNEW